MGIENMEQTINEYEPKEAIIVALDTSSSMGGKAGFLDDYDPKKNKIN
jgi:uncharacterized protein with von Willebrand factor type A (vWA) domain